MNILKEILNSPLPSVVVIAGLLLIIVSFVNLPSIVLSDPKSRVQARWFGIILFIFGISLYLLSSLPFNTPPEDISKQVSSSPTTTKQTTPATTLPSTQTDSQYILKTFKKNGSNNIYESEFSSTEKIFAEFNFNNSDIADKTKIVRWVKPGPNRGKYKTVENSGEVEIGTLPPGTYNIRGEFLQTNKRFEVLVQISIEVIRKT